MLLIARSPACDRRIDSAAPRRIARDASSLAATELDNILAGGRVVDRSMGGGCEAGAVENPRRLVADPLKHLPDGAVALRHALFAGCVSRLADAGHEGERPVKGADHLADADPIGRASELIAAVRT